MLALSLYIILAGLFELGMGNFLKINEFFMALISKVIILLIILSITLLKLKKIEDTSIRKGVVIGYIIFILVLLFTSPYNF
jgi:hypothetical protein